MFALLTSAQAADNPGGKGAALLLLSRSGIPISFDQIDERSRTQDGASTDEVIKSKVYRDSSGRIRTEESTQIDLIDPVAGSRVILLSTKRVACRMPWPKSAEGKFAFLGITDEAASWGNSTATSEHIGKRTIEGIEFDGTRIIQTAEGEP